MRQLCSGLIHSGLKFAVGADAAIFQHCKCLIHESQFVCIWAIAEVTAVSAIYQIEKTVFEIQDDMDCQENEHFQFRTSPAVFGIAADMDMMLVGAIFLFIFDLAGCFLCSFLRSGFPVIAEGFPNVFISESAVTAFSGIGIRHGISDGAFRFTDLISGLLH